MLTQQIVGSADIVHLLLDSESATDALAKDLSSSLRPGARIYLSGDLGAGKTRFVRGVLRGLGHTGRVRSPTFTLLEPYEVSDLLIHHFDFYRFSGENEFRDAGFDEYLADPDAVVLIEWPERAGRFLPAPDLWLRLSNVVAAQELGDDETPSQRLLQIDAFSEWASAWMRRQTPHRLPTDTGGSF